MEWECYVLIDWVYIHQLLQWYEKFYKKKKKTETTTGGPEMFDSIYLISEKWYACKFKLFAGIARKINGYIDANMPLCIMLQ